MKIVYLIFALFFYYSSIVAQASLMKKNGHQSNLESMSISRNGQYFVTVDHERKCIIWDVASKKQFSVIKNVLSAAFAEEEELIYLAMADFTFKMVNLSGITVKNLSQITYKINSDSRPDFPKFYPKAQTLLMKGVVINMNTGKMNLMKVKSENFGVYQDYYPERNEVAIASYNENVVTTYDAANGDLKQSYHLSAKTSSNKYVKYSADGNLLAIATKSLLQILELKTGKVVKSIVPEDYIEQIAFSPDGSRIAWITYKDLVIVNLKTGEKDFSIKHENKNMSSNNFGNLMTFESSGKKLLVGNKSNISLFNAVTGKIEKDFTSNLEIETQGAFILGNGKYLSTYTSDSYAVLWNLLTGSLERTVPLLERGEKWLRSDKNASIFFLSDNDTIKEYQANGNLLHKYPGSNKEIGVDDLQVSYQGNYFFNLGRPVQKLCNEGSSIKVIDSKTHKTVWQKPCGIVSAAFSNTRNILAIKEKYSSTNIEFYEIPSGKLVYSIQIPDLKDDDPYIAFSENDKYVQVGNTAHGNGIRLIELASKKISKVSGKIVDEINENQNFIYSTSISPDEKVLAIGVLKGAIYFYDIASGTFDETKTIKAHESLVTGIGFLKNGRFMFTASYDAETLKLWDLNTKQLMATLYPNPTLGEWAVISPNGRFDANNNAQANMFHVYGNQIVPLSTMFEKYYTPKLLSRILAGEKFDNLTDVKKLKKIPKLTLQFKEGNRNINVDEDVPIPTFQTKFANATIVINAECPLDAVSEIRLFQNGKLVETTRNLKVVEDKRDEKNVIKTIQVTLVDGSNTFRAIALNTERSESIPIEMHVEYNREHANNVQKNREKEIQLHVVVVGINTYKNPKYNLNYAAADANAFKAVLENGAVNLFSKINMYYINDEKEDNTINE